MVSKPLSVNNIHIGLNNHWLENLQNIQEFWDHWNNIAGRPTSGSLQNSMIFLAGHISNYSQFSVALADMLQPLFNLVTITSVYRSIMYQILKTIIHYSICCEAQTKCIFWCQRHVLAWPAYSGNFSLQVSMICLWTFSTAVNHRWQGKKIHTNMRHGSMVTCSKCGSMTDFACITPAVSTSFSRFSLVS